MDQKKLYKKEYKISVKKYFVNLLLNNVKCNTGIRSDVVGNKLSNVTVMFYTEYLHANITSSVFLILHSM